MYVLLVYQYLHVLLVLSHLLPMFTKQKVTLSEQLPHIRVGPDYQT